MSVVPSLVVDAYTPSPVYLVRPGDGSRRSVEVDGV